MAGLTSTLTMRLIDAVTGPASAIGASLRKLNGAASSTSRMGALGGIFAGQAAAGRSLAASFTGVAAGAAVAGYAIKRAFTGPVNTFLEFDTVLESIGQKADLSGGRLDNLGASIRKIANATGTSAQKTAEAFDTLFGLGLGGATNEADVSAALAMIPAINKVSIAYRAASEDVAKAGQASFANLKVPAENIMKAFDAMAASGKAGGFELKDMAQYFPALTSQAVNLGSRGVEGVADLAAALQVVRQGAGDAAEAATNLGNVMQKAKAPRTVKGFSQFGIKIRDEIDKGVKAGKSPIETLVEQTQKAFKKGAVISDLFEDAQVQKGLLALLADMPRYRKIREEALAASGMVEADYARRVQTAQARLDRFNASLENMRLGIGTAIMPGLTSMFDSLANALNTMDQRVGVFDKIREAFSGLSSGLGFKGGFAEGFQGFVDLVFGRLETFERDSDRLSAVFFKFREIGAALREFGSAVGTVVEPMRAFLGLDWSTVIAYGATFGTIAVGFAAFAGAVRLIGGALLTLSGARLGFSILAGLIAMGGGGAAGVGAAAGGAAAGAGLLTLGLRIAALARSLTALGAAILVVKEGWDFIERLGNVGTTESTAPRPLDEKYKQDHPAYTPPEGGSQGFYDRRMEERNRLREGRGLPPVSMDQAIEASKTKSAEAAASLDQSAAASAAGQATGQGYLSGLSAQLEAAKSMVAAAAADMQRQLSFTATPIIAPKVQGLGQSVRGIQADTGVTTP
jgi:hypothetical protein